MSLFNELKRRNVFRVGAAYLVVAWLLVQVVDTLGDMFALPDAFGRGVVILLAIGFPIALLISWVYELTPEGITTQEDVDAGVKSTSGRKLNTVIIGGLALALALVIIDAYVLIDDDLNIVEEVAIQESTDSFQGENTDTTDLDKSIAVLPFVNLSSDPEQEYFSDGLTEEILNQLVQYDELRVIARTSSFAFKGINDDLRDIGEQLGVSFLLEGSVRKSNNDLRITAQLIRAYDGSHLWSQTFDRELSDIFAIQDEIAMAVATAMSITLDAGEFSIAREGTNDLDAYDAYLRALELYSRRGSGEDFSRSVDYFREAVDLDPQFLRAWRGLYASLEGIIIYVPDQAEQARQEMDRVREQLADIAPDSATYRGILASWNMDQRNWLEAENAYTGGSQLSLDAPWFSMQPMTASTAYSYSTFLLNTGRLTDSARLVLRNNRDPLSLASTYIRQIMYWIMGRFEESEMEFQRALTLQGDHYLVSQMEVLNATTRDDLTPAEKAEAMSAHFEEYADVIPYSNMALWEAADDEARRQLLPELFTDGRNDSATKFLLLAFWASRLDESDLVLEGLRRSYVDFGGTNLGVLWSPAFSQARIQPEFNTIVEELGFVEYWRATGNWPDKCQPLEGSDDFECF